MCLRTHLILSETFLVVTTKRKLASSEQRAEMLLNILQSTRQPPTANNCVAKNVNSAKVEKFGLEQTMVIYLELQFTH